MLNLTPKQKEKIREIAEKYHLNFLVVFGSEADGVTHKKSDLDLAYSAKDDLNSQKEYTLMEELRKIFETKTEIELLDLRLASPLLLKIIAFSGKLLVEITPRSFSNFQMYAFKLFVEFKPLLRLRDQYIAKNL